jgi:hypothetical protein
MLVAVLLVAASRRTFDQAAGWAAPELDPHPPAATQSAATSPGGAPPSFVGDYPTDAATRELYDEMDYQRAVQAYIWATPLVNSVALEKALVNARVSPTEPSLLVFDKRVGPKQIIMTANSEVIYAFSVLDLAKTGPVVVEVPAGLPGGFWDMWERGIEDIGLGRSRKDARGERSHGPRDCASGTARYSASHSSVSLAMFVVDNPAGSSPSNPASASRKSSVESIPPASLS